MKARAAACGMVLLAAGLGLAPELHAAKGHAKNKAARAAETSAPKKRPRPPAAAPQAEEPGPLPGPAPAEIDVSTFTGELPLTAQGATVIDAPTGKTIYEKNAEQPFFPASTTKILTALLIIEAGGLEQPVIADIEDARVPESSLQLQPGEAHTRREMLYGLMLKSANDVAHALARDNAGSIEAFAEKMNARARELGATGSHFANPNGLHDAQHFTTPHDLALITRAAMLQPLFRAIVGTTSHGWQGAASLQLLTNHNRLLGAFPGCTGVKTGYTRPAGNVLVSSARWGTREMISVVMHTDRPGQWEDSKLLLRYGFAHAPEPPFPAP